MNWRFGSPRDLFPRGGDRERKIKFEGGLLSKKKDKKTLPMVPRLEHKLRCLIK